MSDLTIRDLVLHYLQKDYADRATIIGKLTNHVDKLYDNFVLTTDDRKRIMRNVSELINNLNKTYNSTLIQLEFNRGVIDDDDDNYKCHIDAEMVDNLDCTLKTLTNEKPTNLITVVEIMDVLRNYNVVKDFAPKCKFSNFNSIDVSLKQIACEIGLYDIDDIIYMYRLDKTNPDDEMYLEKISLLKMGFVPMSIKKLDGKLTDTIDITCNNPEDSKYELILSGIYTIKIYSSLDDITCLITGFLIPDCINSTVRTCQICKEYLYEKKKKMCDMIEDMNNINKHFKNIYIKNLTIGDILSTDKKDVKTKVTEDYQKYMKYCNMSFKVMMSEFLQADMQTKFSMIKFLLMGQTNSVNIAGLLFGVTKDIKESLDNNSKPTLISDIIYKNLNYPSQIKLRKSSTVISQELEKLKSLSSDDVDLKKQIVTNKNMPQYVKKIALEKLEEMKSGSSEYYKQLQYVKILVDYPWIGETDEDIFSSIGCDNDKCIEFLDKLKSFLDSKVYGHNKCKEAMSELVAKWTSNPESLGKVIGLRGPPGVGKTLFAKTLGEALGIPFTQINIGGVDDGSVLSGHSFTYSSAQPGLIVKKMIAAGSPRCIMFFDEVDKTGAKHGINEVTNVLIHATDYNSNDKFNDKFLQEIGFPLNKVLFVFSYNDRNKIDRILLDRIEEIDVSAYSPEDKIQITKDHLIKELSKDIGIEPGSVEISDDAIMYLVESFTNEPGVRELKRKLEKILTKLNVDRVYGRDPFSKSRVFSKHTPIVIDKLLTDKYLIKPNILIKRVHVNDEVGVINGLYATTIGMGGVLPILVYKNYSVKEGFKLKLTGSQKRVMRESIMFAMTIATNIVEDRYIKQFLQNNPNGLHIHTPDGATPKDGPSAGAAFTTAIISRMLQKKIKHNIAMTGEIETNGLVTAIGGLECKLSGAKRAGVKLVFAPKENESDYDKILKTNKTLIDDNFKVKFVDHITEILDYALIDGDLLDELTKKGISDIVYEKTFDWTKYIDKDKNSRELAPLKLKKREIFKTSTKSSDSGSDEMSKNHIDSDMLVESSVETETDTDSESTCSSESEC
jgi:endopeptidase La